jgi:hypothetical protein
LGVQSKVEETNEALSLAVPSPPALFGRSPICLPSPACGRGVGGEGWGERVARKGRERVSFHTARSAGYFLKTLTTRCAAPSPAPDGAPSPPKVWGRGNGKQLCFICFFHFGLHPLPRHCEARSAVAIQTAVQLPQTPRQRERPLGLRPSLVTRFGGWIWRSASRFAFDEKPQNTKEKQRNVSIPLVLRCLFPKKGQALPALFC